MSATVTTPAEGAVALASTQVANAKAVRDWVNGGSVGGDLSGTLFQSRHFRKGDFLPLSGVVRKFVCSSGGTWEVNYNTALNHRVALHPSSHGFAYADIAEFGIKDTIPAAGTIVMEATWWAWAIQSDRTPATVGNAGWIESIRQCTFSAFINGTKSSPSERNLYDAGSDSSTVQAGQALYPARAFSVQARASVSAGAFSARMKVNFVNPGAALMAEWPLVWIGARQLLVTWEPF